MKKILLTLALLCWALPVSAQSVVFPPQSITIGSTSTTVKIMANGCWYTTSAITGTNVTWNRLSCRTSDGALRVADETALPGLTEGFTLSASPTVGPVWALGRGLIANGSSLSDIACPNSIIYDASTSGNTQLVAISGSTNIYVCSYEIFTPGTVNISLVAGTGSACASAISGTPSTGTSGASAALTPAWQFTAGMGKMSAWPVHGSLLSTGTANALCIKTSGAVAVQAQVWYQQR